MDESLHELASSSCVDDVDRQRIDFAEGWPKGGAVHVGSVTHAYVVQRQRAGMIQELCGRLGSPRSKRGVRFRYCLPPTRATRSSLI